MLQFSHDNHHQKPFENGHNTEPAQTHTVTSEPNAGSMAAKSTDLQETTDELGARKKRQPQMNEASLLFIIMHALCQLLIKPSNSDIYHRSPTSC
jgi:hypothetical protein